MTRTIQVLATVIAGFVLGACANSGSTPTSFTPQSPTALLVLAGPTYPFAANTGLRRVDLAEGRFEQDYVGFGTGGLQSGQVNRDGPAYFSVREVVPGDYALVSLLAVPGGTYWTCFPQGGPVFRLRAGDVTIVNSLPFWFGMGGLPSPARVSDAELLAAFANVRTTLPGLQGPAQVAPVVRTVRWQSGMGATRQCSESATFEPVG